MKHTKLTENPIPLLQADNVSLGYDNQPDLLSGLSFSVYKTDFIGVIGPNGGGKTTLVKGILGLLPSRTGSWTFYDNNNKPIPRPAIGYVPQQNQVDKAFPISVQEVVAYGLGNNMGWRPTPHDWDLVHAELHRIGMFPYRNRAIGELSGGQLQRVLIARALVSRPRLVIFDEPNTYVDQQFEHQLYNLLPTINKESAIILVSHDIGTVSRMVRTLFCVNRELHIHQNVHELCPDCVQGLALEYLSVLQHR